MHIPFLRLRTWPALTQITRARMEGELSSRNIDLLFESVEDVELGGLNGAPTRSSHVKN
jgi:hypothetical protein